MIAGACDTANEAKDSKIINWLCVATQVEDRPLRLLLPKHQTSFETLQSYHDSISNIMVIPAFLPSPYTRLQSECSHVVAHMQPALLVLPAPPQKTHPPSSAGGPWLS